jgi:hypothetical protein
MARVMTETEWLRSAGELTVSADGLPSDADQIAAAETAVAWLIALARALPHCADTAHHPAGGSHTACAFADLPSGERACRLATDLAHLPGEDRVAVLERGRDTATHFLRAVSAAAPAVYLCRRVRHISGHCWFRDSGADEDVCGRILALAHRL